MATAKPVVATAQGGPLEIVADGETGRLVPPRDPEAMAHAVAHLLDHPALGRAMGEAGRRRVLAHYLVDREIAAVEALYQDLLARRPSAHASRAE
jgi:glycosyltransferase involved in cell wall biosynthesis